MRGPWNVVLNVIWLLLSGIWLALGYVVAGVIACALIVTIPFGIACFRIAGFVLWPFGREIVSRPSDPLGVFANIVWFLVAGIPLALGHLVTAFFLALTVVGLPLAWINLKMVPLTCFPFGKVIVDRDHHLAARYPGAFGTPAHVVSPALPPAASWAAPAYGAHAYPVPRAHPGARPGYAPPPGYGPPPGAGPSFY